MRSDPPWLGALRMRQALAAAAASARLLRLREDAAALRDAHLLTRPTKNRRPGDDPGPAGRLHRAWRNFSARPAHFGSATVGRLAQELGLAPPASVLEQPARGGGPVGAAAAAAAALALAAGCQPRPSRPPRPETEILGLMAADLALANGLGWATPVPLLATAMLHPTLRFGPDGRRVRPGDAGWPALCHRAFANAALEAHARDRARPPRRKTPCRRRPRAHAGGEAGVAALLADDAVAATALTQLGSDRAARRFLERLAALGAVREFTGRPTFRLDGL